MSGEADHLREALRRVLAIGVEANGGDRAANAAMEAVCHAARSFGWRRAVVVTTGASDADDQVVTLAGASGVDDETLEKLSLRLLAGADADAFAESRRVGDAYLLDRLESAFDGLAVSPSAPTDATVGLFVPVRHAGARLGALVVDGPVDGEPPSPPHVNFLEALADMASVALRLARADERARTHSTVDAATGLANRRALDAALRREIERALRHSLPVSIVSVEIDRLDRVAEERGAAAGDRVARAVARVLREGLRQVDLATAGSTNGEFLLLLPGASTDNAREVAERLRCAVASEHAPEVGSVTATFGVATLPEHAANGAGLLQAASAALDLARRRGRNRVAVAVPLGRRG